MSGKRYPEEFKIEAVKQVVDRGHSIAGMFTAGLALVEGRPLHPYISREDDNDLDIKGYE